MSPRTGPVGRLARAAWAVAFVATLASIVDPRGSARFRDPHILTEPTAWLLHGLMVVVFVVLIGVLAGTLLGPGAVRRARAAGISVLIVIAAAAGAIGQLTRGAVWGYPLADAVWVFDVAMAGQELAAFVLAILLGTPGCEIGVWSAIIARIRGGVASPPRVLACVVGLDWIDRWEARR